MSKDADPDKYFYSGYGVGFNTCGVFYLAVGIRFGKIVIIFGVDKSSVHANKRQKYILVLNKGPTDRLDD